ncbi:MAG TPA: DUF721 domain-containing protein [Coriobacteriia bacterium]|nr:DUF721 domain-containing protein [Coriobacteriia bacterium]
MSDAVRELVLSSGAAQGSRQARVVEAWSEVAGPEIERHTLSAGLRGGELVVQVGSHAWATELAALSEELRARLNSVLGEEAVRTIRFTVSRSVSQAHAAVGAEEDVSRRWGGEFVEPQPLTREEVAEIESQASAIEHEGVRHAVVRAQVKELEVRKARMARERTNGHEKARTEGAWRQGEPQDLW